ncbi:MAG: YggS family pyridoxal phosphate enzyme, partial [Clostridia bacterium]|nr:YggS family pyridoxal phosphate enzyme [Clostridia bacterium]
MEKVFENLNAILANIDEVTAKAGLDASAVEIIGASKFRSIETLRALSADGRVTVFGENKVQEFNSKYDENFTWDIIGQLQTNKVKYVVGKVRYISS